jgi:hypothetical protein
MTGELFTVEVAQVQVDCGFVFLCGARQRVHEALATLGRLRREAIPRQAGDEVRSNLDGDRHPALGGTGMDAYPQEDHLNLQCPERLGLNLARGRAVDRVGGPATSHKRRVKRPATLRPHLATGLPFRKLDHYDRFRSIRQDVLWGGEVKI